MIITKQELKETNVHEVLKNENNIIIKDGRHAIHNVNGKIKVVKRDGLTPLKDNHIPKYIKNAIANSVDVSSEEEITEQAIEIIEDNETEVFDEDQSELFVTLLEKTNYDDDIVSDIMIMVEEMIISEILEIDAIMKWEEINQALNEDRTIRQVDHEPTDVPQMMLKDKNFEMAVERKASQITDNIFDKMTVEQFNHWIKDIDLIIELTKNKMNWA